MTVVRDYEPDEREDYEGMCSYVFDTHLTPTFHELIHN